MSNAHNDKLHESAAASKAVDINAKIYYGDEDERRPVVDKKAYDQYMEMSKAALGVKRTLETSIEDLVIDAAGTPQHIESLCRRHGLTKTETAKLLRHKQVFDIYANRLRSLEIQAFGSNIDFQLPTQFIKRVIEHKGSDIIAMFGAYYTMQEVLKRIRVDWGYVGFPQKFLKTFRKNNEAEITRLQEIHQRDHSDIRLTHKKSRLQELSEMYYKLKDRYELTHNREDIKLSLQILKQVQNEVEGTKLHVEGEFLHRVEVQLQQHIHKEILDGLVINDIVIARTARRLGINGRYIIERLHKSLYTQFAGFGGATQDLYEKDPEYPSQLVYDWNSIKQDHEKNEDVYKELMTEEVPTVEESASLNALQQIAENALAKRNRMMTDLGSSEVLEDLYTEDQKGEDITPPKDETKD